MGTHLNRIAEAVEMSIHDVRFNGEITIYHQILVLSVLFIVISLIFIADVFMYFSLTLCFLVLHMHKCWKLLW